ncbi:MAG: energy-coupling factor transporter transmembrane protein EcfT [Candidatus Eisenbacteria bacterium]|jgi:energy-coupling factor transporter transmembrane protein EcfT|nr:energy-coupling factor transporter transmembrane protein EcfT [Candidatus Eisenbacteria bacterium]
MPRSPLRTIDARARILAFSLSLIVAVSAVGSSPVTLAALCVFPTLLILVARVPWKTILRRLSFVGAFIVLAGVFTFVVPLTARPSPARFWFLLFGSLFAVISTATVAYSTTATEAMEALQRLRIPHHVIWTGALGLRYLPLVFGEGKKVHRAAQARGWGQGVTCATGRSVTCHSLTPIGWMTASLMSRGFDRALRTGEAMEARGFGSNKVVLEPCPLKARDWVVMAGYPGVLLAVRLLLHGVAS